MVKILKSLRFNGNKSSTFLIKFFLAGKTQMSKVESTCRKTMNHQKEKQKLR